VAALYAKLALRNARRSARDYLLYMTTLVVLAALMMFSNLLAAASSQNGLQASAVPLLISIVMMALLGYINGYMMRRRAKEFATYILLGMKKSRIACVFFGESLLLSLVGLAVGMALGSAAYGLLFSILQNFFTLTAHGSVYGVAARDSVLYFCAISVVSLLGCVRKVRKLTIKSLLSEGQKNQSLRSKPRPVFWSCACFACLVADWVLVCLITSGDSVLMMLGVNAVVFPLVLGIGAFYMAAFHWLSWLREHRASALYQGNRLYFVARLLSKVSSNMALDTVLCVCLLFSVITFCVGFVMPNISGELMRQETGNWMSFAEMCMCIVFIAIYFSILAVKQVTEARENHRAFRIMAYLGKTNRQGKALIRQDIVLHYTLPTAMCALVLSLCIGRVNSFLNAFLSVDHLLLMAIGVFSACFLLLYAGYAFVAYRISVGSMA
jgi:ABC-type antimicrobial peptide transport system permease subunit